MRGVAWKVIRILSVMAFAGGVAAAQSVPAKPDSVDQIVTQEMGARKIPGVSIAVIDNGRIVKEASYGLASVEFGVPVTNATLFTLASTTKEFTAVAVMVLVEDGLLSLDDSVRRYLPELPPAWAPVRSGIACRTPPVFRMVSRRIRSISFPWPVIVRVC
jgi:CubicO group peptidase (beta-lactamase class C family)